MLVFFWGEGGRGARFHLYAYVFLRILYMVRCLVGCWCLVGGGTGGIADGSRQHISEWGWKMGDLHVVARNGKPKRYVAVTK